jgi:hypothetical protein
MLVAWGEKPFENIVVHVGVARIYPLDIFEIHPPPSRVFL